MREGILHGLYLITDFEIPKSVELCNEKPIIMDWYWPPSALLISGEFGVDEFFSVGAVGVELIQHQAGAGDVTAN